MRAILLNSGDIDSPLADQYPMSSGEDECRGHLRHGDGMGNLGG